MIPRAMVTAWRASAPWPLDAQVEQDLVLSRALIELYGNPVVARTVAFRGGTALHKLVLPQPGRYSEDIDLVQVAPGPIGRLLDAVRAVLDPWLGEPARKQTRDDATLVYRFATTSLPVQSMRLKVEVNTREHGTVQGTEHRVFRVETSWFTGRSAILTYPVEELLGTKLRALYQRRKGRDLFDLWCALGALSVDPDGVVAALGRHLKRQGLQVTRAQFERNLAGKVRMPEFRDDVLPLLSTGTRYDPDAALAAILTGLVQHLPGKPWRKPHRSSGVMSPMREVVA